MRMKPRSTVHNSRALLYKRYTEIDVNINPSTIYHTADGKYFYFSIDNLSFIEYTGSTQGKDIVDVDENTVLHFNNVAPNEYTDVYYRYYNKKWTTIEEPETNINRDLLANTCHLYVTPNGFVNDWELSDVTYITSTISGGNSTLCNSRFTPTDAEEYGFFLLENIPFTARYKLSFEDTGGLVQEKANFRLTTYVVSGGYRSLISDITNPSIDILSNPYLRFEGSFNLPEDMLSLTDGAYLEQELTIERDVSAPTITAKVRCGPNTTPAIPSETDFTFTFISYGFGNDKLSLQYVVESNVIGEDEQYIGYIVGQDYYKTSENFRFDNPYIIGTIVSSDGPDSSELDLFVLDKKDRQPQYGDIVVWGQPNGGENGQDITWICMYFNGPYWINHVVTSPSYDERALISALVYEKLGRAPFEGDVIVWNDRTRDYKCLYTDGAWDTDEIESSHWVSRVDTRIITTNPIKNLNYEYSISAFTESPLESAYAFVCDDLGTLEMYEASNVSAGEFSLVKTEITDEWRYVIDLIIQREGLSGKTNWIYTSVSPSDEVYNTFMYFINLPAIYIEILNTDGVRSLSKYQTNKYYYAGSFDYMIRGSINSKDSQPIKGNIMHLRSFEIKHFDDRINLDHDDLVVIDGHLYSVESLAYDVKRSPKPYTVYFATLNNIK